MSNSEHGRRDRISCRQTGIPFALSSAPSAPTLPPRLEPDVRLLNSEQEKSDAVELHWLEESRKPDERVHGVEDRRRHPERYAPDRAHFFAVGATIMRARLGGKVALRAPSRGRGVKQFAD